MSNHYKTEKKVIEIQILFVQSETNLLEGVWGHGPCVDSFVFFKF